MAITRVNEIPTIDVNLVTVQRSDMVGAPEFILDTSSKIAVEPQMNDQEAVQLIVKGVLKAQKKKSSTLTGNQITLTDNVFTPELVLLLQGGEIQYKLDDDDQPTDEIIGYIPPVAGSTVEKAVFTLKAYSAVYDAAGNILKYECISYPNCTGQPIAFGSEDNVFRVQEYVIDSAPSNGEAPYTITYVSVDEFNAIVTP